MNTMADRVSGLFFMALGLAMYFWINPNYIETVDGGNISPATLPNIISIILAIAGAFIAIKPTDHQLRNPILMAKTGLYVALLTAGIWAMSWFGFEYVAPVLALAIMWLIGERRPLWLGLGVVAMPAIIWFLVTQLLGRALP
ncbi:tripartite tricarboxylate transporter TctB family protein [Rhodalgimonas zhirmunskyi]|uniref:Tripartite tricarboxylate transporter TctB family protein n=1 Tax=Rhodalgimonas zhirmunskyi TaxID=2964767 RepID=A0AAJ1UGP0_9RHOB|nr:tripartite tricarboxylate transporter TctB family protein [Rhodoalgimonas zhirmunskyi]MDQ2095567.1 tripartite tricarboxylate transporter TctB family protein [Rhodoalgimonas zhirmunskyi]